jgi:hypothetical protein
VVSARREELFEIVWLDDDLAAVCDEVGMIRIIRTPLGPACLGQRGREPMGTRAGSRTNSAAKERERTNILLVSSSRSLCLCTNH